MARSSLSTQASRPIHLGTLVLNLEAQPADLDPDDWFPLVELLDQDFSYDANSTPAFAALSHLLNKDEMSIDGDYKVGEGRIIVRCWVTPPAGVDGLREPSQRTKTSRKVIFERLRRSWEDADGPSVLATDPNDDYVHMADLYAGITSPPNFDLNSPSSVFDEETKRWLRIFGDLDADENDRVLNQLHDYQVRSVAQIITRETKPGQHLDPSYTPMREAGRSGVYYLNTRTYDVLRTPKWYDLARGGILAEQMGTGKSLIALAVILATLHQRPTPPPSAGEAFLERTDDYYELAPLPEGRSSSIPEEHRKGYLAKTTLIVCPPILVGQCTWELEIESHFAPGTFSVLNANEGELPDIEILKQYSIVLMSTERFARESTSHRAKLGRAPSVLLQARWKRLMLDEGHIAGEKWSEAMILAKEMNIERSWLVSGTPLVHLTQEDDAGPDVLGTAASEHGSPTPEGNGEKTRAWTKRDKDDASRLGIVLGGFLAIEPFTSIKVYRATVTTPLYSKDGPKFGAIKRMRHLMSSLIIKHSPQLIAAETALPPCQLTYERLKFTSMQKITFNAICALIASNVLTTSGRDPGALLHKNNRKLFKEAIGNLHLACFWLCQSGMVKQETGVADCITRTQGYIDVEADDDKRAQLQRVVDHLRAAQAYPGWTDWMQSGRSLAMEARELPLPLRQLCGGSPDDDEAVTAGSLIQLEYDHPDGVNGVVIPATIQSTSRSSKVNFIVQAVQEAEPDEKFVIFGNGSQEMGHLQDVLELCEISSCFVGYEISTPDRVDQLRKFQSPRCRVCLLDLRLAARGLNLMVANRLILMSPVWSAGTLAQVIKRCHRIGQTRETRVQILAVEGTLEEYIVDHVNRSCSKNEQDSYARTIMKNPQYVADCMTLDEQEYFEIKLKHVPEPIALAAPSPSIRDDTPASVTPEPGTPAGQEEFDIDEMLEVKDEVEGFEFMAVDVGVQVAEEEDDFIILDHNPMIVADDEERPRKRARARTSHSSGLGRRVSVIRAA